MIIDAHIHNSQPDFKNMDLLLKHSKHIGIKLVWNLGDVLAYGLTPSAQEVKSINDRSLQLDEKYSNSMRSFCFLNPANETKFSLDEMDRCRDIMGSSFLGIKLEAGLNCRSEKLNPIIKKAETLECLVVQHSWYKATGRELGESDPADVADLARRFPKVQIICPHLAGIGKRGILDLTPYPNVMVDTSGGQPVAGLLEYAAEKMGAERILFGSDAYGAAGRDQACQLGRVLGANISDRDKNLIIGENAERLLKL